MRWSVLLLVLLVGCTSPEPSTREDQFFLNVTTNGEWRIRVPMPDDAWSRGQWQDWVQVSIGNATLRWVEGDLPLEVSGNGTVRIEALPRWREPQPLLAANQAVWTAGDMDAGRTVVEVLEGHIGTMRMEHTALVCRGAGCIEVGKSKDTCFTEVRFFATDLGVGSHDVAVQPVSRTCEA